MAEPAKLDKYLYVRGLSTWKVRTLYLGGLFTWLLVLWGFSGAILVDPFYKWFVAPILGVLTVYHTVSFCLNTAYRQFDLEKHFRKVREYWKPVRDRGPVIDIISPRKLQPTVDIFLPICGEDIPILHNTWAHVARLNYTNRKVFVLDDSKNNCEKHKELAESFNFTYIERLNKGEMKKAGNLKYAYERTNGEFIAIFDADFAPHSDFLRELLPYTSDQKVGIVQSPQYFEATKDVYKRSPLAYGAAYHEELFYRVIQVARDRLGGAICCGSNAIYRREALKTIGGPRQVDASEDSRTGFALVAQGWLVRYVPIILAVGVCPDNIYAYFHQQHRWCRGRSELVLSKEFFTSRVPFIIKLCNISGFLSFLSRPLTIAMSFQLFWVIFFYNEYISFSNALIFYPYIVFALVVLPFFHIIRTRPIIFYASVIQLYAGTHALLSVLLRRRVAWVATGSKHTQISPAFKQTMFGVGIYLAVYLFLTSIAALVGFIHLFDISYYSVQFWLFYNIALSVILFSQMYKFYRTSVVTVSK